MILRFEQYARRYGHRLRDRACAAVVALFWLLAAGPGEAQTARTPRAVSAQLVRVTIDTVGGQVQCTPTSIRLQPQAALRMQIANGAPQALWFVAPEFFRYADVAASDMRVLDPTKGGILMAPHSNILLQLKTPDPGQYYYSCSEVGEPPNPLSSGVLVVAPPG